MSKPKAKKSQKSQNSTAKCATKCTLCHPSTWLIALLAIALFVICGLFAYGFKNFEVKTNLDSAKLAVFDHVAESYIRDMEFTTNYDKPAIKQATGYGISDEDGVFYITFDFAPYPATGETISSMDDLDFRHGIVYFQWDAERGTYGHAFSYPNTPDDHPAGVYVKL